MDTVVQTLHVNVNVNSRQQETPEVGIAGKTHAHTPTHTVFVCKERKRLEARSRQNAVMCGERMDGGQEVRWPKHGYRSITM